MVANLNSTPASACTPLRWDPQAIAEEAHDAFEKLFASDEPLRHSRDDTNGAIELPLIPSVATNALYTTFPGNKIAITEKIDPTEAASDESAIVIRMSEPTGATPSIPQDEGDVSDKDSSCTNAISGKADLTWEEALEKAKILGEPIIRAARAARARNFNGETEDNLCNELLDVLRNGPGTQLSSKTYHELTSPLFVEGVEIQPQWSADPPTSLPDKDYQIDDEDPEKNWRAKKIGSKEYLLQWKKYADSPRAWPVLDPDVPTGIKLVPEPDKDSDYEPISSKTEVSNPSHYQQHDFDCNWSFTPTIGWNHGGWLEWFWNWIIKVPLQDNAVDINHKPFFNGTAVPDGGYALLMQDIEHLPTPRDMKDEETRLHWHETATGLIHNIASLNEEVAVDEKKKKGKMKKAPRLTDFEQYWLCRELMRRWTHEGGLRTFLPIPDRKPAVYLRPVTLADLGELLDIIGFHAVHTATSRYGPEICAPGGTWLARGPEVVKDAIEKASDCSLPFIVAVLTDYPEKGDEVIAGYALLEHLSDYDCDNGTAELQVFVHQYHLRKSIGTILVDMILSLCDPGYTRKSTCPWVPAPGMNSYPTYDDELDSVHCGIAFSSHADVPDLPVWTWGWLRRFFNFKQAGFLSRLRSKREGDKLIVVYVRRDASHVSDSEDDGEDDSGDVTSDRTDEKNDEDESDEDEEL